MKSILITLLAITFSFACSSQVYIATDIQTYNSKKIAAGTGGDISAGYIFKKLYFGIGTGLTFFTSDQPYIPVYAEAGLNSRWILSVRAGYGFYNGPGSIAGKDASLKGSYTEQLKMGFDISFHDEKSLQVFTALTHRNFRQDGNSIDKLYFGFGLGFRYR